MKRILLVLTFIVFVLSCWTSTAEHISKHDKTSNMEYVQAISEELVKDLAEDDEYLQDYSPIEQWLNQMGYDNINGLLQQIRFSTFRPMPISIRLNTELIKSTTKTITEHTNHLFSCATRHYTSIRCCNWAFPSECYVFGIRHIII